MVFSTPLALFLFLPLLLLLFFLTAQRWRNACLLLCSLFIYTWSEGENSWILLLTIVLTILFARLLAGGRSGRARKWLLAAGIGCNLLILFVYKYAAFFLANLNPLLQHLDLPPFPIPRLPLPLGISFSTFLAISLLIDTYRRSPGKRPGLVSSSLYVSFFPTIMAGPITPFRELAPQLESLDPAALRIHDGARRFIVGLGKKVLLADILGRLATPIFAIPAPDLTFPLAWLGVMAYTLQIYFDFSGYTDMAVGLGLIFGFRFAENFHYPYAATSVSDFWTRWHKSLTRWLRDYLFLPLAYQVLRLVKKERWLGVKAESWAYGIGMAITMLLCGLWHGASWTFVAWGCYHALFILLERFAWKRALKKTWLPARRAYTLIVVALGWLLFRSSGLGQAWSFLKAMVGANRGNPLAYYPQLYLTADALLAFLISLLGAFPLVPALGRWLELRMGRSRVFTAAGKLMGALALAAMMVLCYLYLANETFQPFIYFRF